jgi:hypothetical protein
VEHELPGVLDGADEPVTVEELEAVVRRAGQRRRATLVAAAAALVAVGALGGAIGRGTAGDPRTGLAAGDQTAPVPAYPSKMAEATAMGMAAPGFGEGFPFTPLFRRDSHGVAIRGYRITPPKEAQGPATACQYKPDMIHAGLSNTAAVGMVVVPSFRSGVATLSGGESASDGQLRLNGSGTFGVGEGEPATWAVTEVDSSVATVRLTAGGTTDSMAPSDGVAVLVVPGATTEGTIEALRADGSVVASRALGQSNSWMPDPACTPQACIATSPPLPPDAVTTTPGLAGKLRTEPAQDLPCISKECYLESSGTPTLDQRDDPAPDPKPTVDGGDAGSSTAPAGVCIGPGFPPPPATILPGTPAPDATAPAASSTTAANAAP